MPDGAEAPAKSERHFRDMRAADGRAGASRLGAAMRQASDRGDAVLLLTGATGSIGSRLLPLLLEQRRGRPLPGPRSAPPRGRRVDVQIALGDLGEMADPHTVRQALRGVDTVVHLAATIRDQPPRRIEELNGLATVRLLQAAERGGVRRFVFFSALDAGAAQRTRFFRAKWVAERAVESSPLETTVFAPSIVYDAATPGSPCCAASPSCRCCRCPGRAGALPADLGAGRRRVRGRGAGRRRRRPRYELAGPETLTYDEMSDLVSRIAGRPRDLVHVPLPLIRASLIAAARRLRRGGVCNLGGGRADGGRDGQRAGPADAQALGVEPRRMRDVLAGASREATGSCRWLVAASSRSAPPRRAAAMTLVPPKPDVLLGVSDRGSTEGSTNSPN